MYARFKKTRNANNDIHYEFIEQISLFGCNNGFIPRLLQLKTSPGQNEPYYWHLNIETELMKTTEYSNSTFVIDLKPKQNKTNLSLYEVLDVWGQSDTGWTPILLHLSGLFVDEDPNSINRNYFTRNESQIDGPIYEVLYLDGSVVNGKLIGKWTAPPASPTNATLLWPSTLQYFVRCIKECSPGVLNF